MEDHCSLIFLNFIHPEKANLSTGSAFSGTCRNTGGIFLQAGFAKPTRAQYSPVRYRSKRIPTSPATGVASIQPAWVQVTSSQVLILCNQISMQMTDHTTASVRPESNRNAAATAKQPASVTKGMARSHNPASTATMRQLKEQIGHLGALERFGHDCRLRPAWF